MSRILGIDVGTNSLGLTVRDEDISNKPKEQIVYSSVSLFKSGVDGSGTKESSLAAQRTGFRSQRKLYKIRRYRKWATLKLLIQEGLCPLAMDDLNKWMKYDKNSEVKHIYPVDSVRFQQWIKLDFDGTGIPVDYNIYTLRNELATKQLDFSIEANRFKLGRAIYHIAERRGFKSSKGDTIGNQNVSDELDDESEKKESEMTISGVLTDYMSEHDYPTVGCALFHLNKDDNKRIRGSEYKAVRADLKAEIKYIFDFQEGLSIESNLFKKIYSEKRGIGTIFYKNPLKSQKGNIGKCLLEPAKTRCPESRPEFEEFRTWSFLNTIKFGEGCSQSLSLKQKQDLFKEKFIVANVKDFDFEAIRIWIESKTGCSYKYDRDSKKRTINYQDNTKVSPCNVIYRLNKLLGENWEQWSKNCGTTHTNQKDFASFHPVTYSWEDIWHVCFMAEDEDALSRFSQKIGLPYSELKQLWKSISVNYANLSLKAIKNVNRFLKQGHVYSKSCMLAKLPDIFGDKWNCQVEKEVTSNMDSIVASYHEEKQIVAVVNNLISKYKARLLDDRSRDHETDYVLNEYDYVDINKYIPETYGELTWAAKSKDEQDKIISKVAEIYQSFFADEHHDYIRLKKQEDCFKDFLLKKYDFLTVKVLNKMYHHSNVEYYAPAPNVQLKDKPELSFKLLQSPVLSSLRNPMALRVLHTLRYKVNELIKTGVITDDDTRIVVEVTRELNDANMRWAIAKYDEYRREENAVIVERLGEYFTDITVR